MFRIQGSDPTGEFFNPAYDCLKILDKNPEAKDGFYWVKLSGIVPKKVTAYQMCYFCFLIQAVAPQCFSECSRRYAHFR